MDDLEVNGFITFETHTRFLHYGMDMVMITVIGNKNKVMIKYLKTRMPSI
jgi:hypothetical protein